LLLALHRLARQTKSVIERPGDAALKAQAACEGSRSRPTQVTLKKSGKLVQTARGVVSKDGKTMTNTFTGSDAAGRPVHNVVVFDKQP